MTGKGHVSNGHNGSRGLQDITTTDSPYVVRRRQQEEAEPEDKTARGEAERNGADDEREITKSEPKKGGRRRLRFIAFVLVAIVGVGVALYFKFGRATKIDYFVKGKPKAGAMLQQPGRQEQQGQQIVGEETSSSQVEAAIAQMKEARRTGDEAQAIREGSAPEVSTAGITAPGLSLPSDYVTPRQARSEGASAGESTDGERQQSLRKEERSLGQPKHGTSSLYADEGKVSPAPQATAAAKSAALSLAPRAKAIALPAFGVMLPVRMLGGVVTLRNSIARMELTQDVRGDGWRLKRGTVFVAQSAGDAFDRAYLNVSGFIDPATNRLVKLSGEVLGQDATQGLKGKRRQMSGRWSRAFNRILNVAPGIAQAALARNGGTTVIVPVGGGAGELIPSGADSDRREFVEVAAGASGYILVTDLPDQIKSVDSEPTEYLAETGATKTTQSQLSDSELAELLVNGTPAKIREAMPRMNEEMRRIAALAIGDK